MNSEDKKLCEKSLEIARAETLKHCKAVKLTPRKALKRIAEGLDAHETKTFLDKRTGEVVYSKPLIAHGTRLKAAEMTMSLFDMMPAERKKVEFPDENGKPQKIGGLFTDMERATRLVYLLDQAAKRKKADAKRSGKD